MEETFYYFSQLITLSIQNKFILGIFSLLEAFDIFIYAFSIPGHIRLINIHKSSILSAIEKISFYYHYRKLANCPTETESSSITPCNYPYYLYWIIIIITLFFPLVFFLFIKFCPKKKKTRSKSKWSLFKSIIINFYDHIVFRLLALELYDTIIAFIIQNYQSYGFQIIKIFFFALNIFIWIYYLNTFRLCICFNKDLKYPFDYTYSKLVDLGLFGIKIFISFETWFNYQKSDLKYIFIVLNLLILLILNIYTICWFDCININNCIKGIFILYYGFGFILHFLFFNIECSWFFLAFLFSMIALIPVIIMVFLREMRIKQIINGDDMYKKCSLLFYYYPHEKYYSILTRMCFKEKLIPSSSSSELKTLKITNESFSLRNEKDKTQLKINDLLLFLNHVIDTLSKKHLKNNETKEEFILHLLIIYKKILEKESIDFAIFNQIRKYLTKQKNKNRTYYFNIKFFYNKLCQIDSCINNDKLLSLNCYSELFYSTSKFIKSINTFIEDINFANVKDYFEIANHLDIYLRESKINYNILSLDTKEEYFKVIMKIILENISNSSISKCHSDLFVMEDILTFEDLLDKQFKMDNFLKMKILLKSTKSRIIKVGRELNYLYNKEIDCLFPKAFYDLAKDLFIKAKVQEGLNIHQANKDCGLYEFIIVDNSDNIRTFAYHYKLYHNLNEDILFLDGYYSLGAETLIITEDNGKDEYIILISKKLVKITLFDQQLIVFLRKYDLKICLNSFSEYKIFTMKKYYEYMNKLLKELAEICSCDEIPYIKETIAQLQKSEPSLTEFWFNQIGKIKDNRRNVILNLNKLENFSCDIQKHDAKKYIDTRKESQSKRGSNEFIHNFLPKINHFNYTFDNYSTSSVSSNVSTSSKPKIKIRKKKEKKMNKSNSYIIIILNLIVISIGCFCLLYENSLNVSFLSLLTLYRSLYVINRTISHTMISFLSLLCFTINPNQFCDQRFLNYLNRNEEFSSLYTFTYLELIAKINFITENIDQLRIQFSERNDNELDNIFDQMAYVCHLKYENFKFDENDRLVDMSSVLIAFINKMTVLIDNQALLSIDVYPIKLDENFKVVSIVPNVSELSQDQLYIYELLTRYLEYTNIFLIYQKTIEAYINKNNNKNFMTIIIFIVVIVLANVFIIYLCWIFLRKFNKLIILQINKIQSILLNKSNVTKLKQKYIYLNELKKLYYKNPTKIIMQLIEITQKKKSKLKTSRTVISNTIKDEEDNNNSSLQLNTNNARDNVKIDLSFVTSYFCIVLFTFGIVYIVYSSVFYVLFVYSFNQIDNIVDILKKSTKMEEETYLAICLVHLLEFTNIKSETLYNLFFEHFNSTNDEKYNKILESNDFFQVLINSIEISFQNEAVIHSNSTFFVPHSNILDFNCTKMFTEFNDILYANIFPFHQDEHYERALINFCLHNKIISIKNERSLLIELHYRNMKLLSYYSIDDNIQKNPLDIEELYLLTGQVLFIFRPLRTYLSNFYFNVVLQNILDNHFAFLITFLVGNIILQIINFILVKMKILNKMEKYNENIEGLYIALKVN